MKKYFALCMLLSLPGMSFAMEEVTPKNEEQTEKVSEKRRETLEAFRENFLEFNAKNATCVLMVTLFEVLKRLDELATKLANSAPERDPKFEFKDRDEAKRFVWLSYVLENRKKALKLMKDIVESGN